MLDLEGERALSRPADSPKRCRGSITCSRREVHHPPRHRRRIAEQAHRDGHRGSETHTASLRRGRAALDAAVFGAARQGLLPPLTADHLLAVVELTAEGRTLRREVGDRDSGSRISDSRDGGG